MTTGALLTWEDVLCEETISPGWKDTCQVRKIRGRRQGRRRVRIGAPDASVTGCAGVTVLSEMLDRLGVVAALDTAVGPIKSRDRGATAGQLLVSLAQAQLCGHDYLVGLDRVRADTAAGALSAVPIPASTTAAPDRRSRSPTAGDTA